MTNTLRPILFVLFSLLLIMQVLVCIDGAQLASDGRADFRHLYTAGYMIRSGHANQIYDYDTVTAFQDSVVGPAPPFPPFDHLAYEALLFVPFSFLSYRVAYFVFFALNLVLLGAATWLFKPYLYPLEAIGPWMPYAVFFCFLPVSLALVLGQDSILLLTLMIASFVSLHREHEVRSGVLLGLGLFKFQYVIPIALLFFIWRKWRFVYGLLLSGTVLMALSIWIVGLSATRAFGRTLFVMSIGLSSNTLRMKYATFPERMPNLRGFIDVAAQFFAVTQYRVAILVVLCSALLIALAAKMKASFSLAVTAATLSSYHGLMHDAAVLIIPIGMVLARSIPRRAIGATAIALTVLILPAVMFRFFNARYFVMAIPICVLMWVSRSAADDFP